MPQVIDAIPDHRPEGVLREGVDVDGDRLSTPDLTGLLGLADGPLFLVLERVSKRLDVAKGDQAERFADEHEETVDVGAVGALGVLRPGSQSSTNSWSAKL